MKSPKGRKPLFERLKTGMDERIRHAEGEISLKSTTVEMPNLPHEIGVDGLTTLRLESRLSQSVFARVLNDQDCPELGTGRAKALAGDLEADPGVS